MIIKCFDFSRGDTYLITSIIQREFGLVAKRETARIVMVRAKVRVAVVRRAARRVSAGGRVDGTARGRGQQVDAGPGTGAGATTRRYFLPA